MKEFQVRDPAHVPLVGRVVVGIVVGPDVVGRRVGGRYAGGSVGGWRGSRAAGRDPGWTVDVHVRCVVLVVVGHVVDELAEELGGEDDQANDRHPLEPHVVIEVEVTERNADAHTDQVPCGAMHATNE